MGRRRLEKGRSIWTGRKDVSNIVDDSPPLDAAEIKRRAEELWNRPGVFAPNKKTRFRHPGLSHGGYNLPKGKKP